MDPSQVLNQRFGPLPLTHVGDLTVNSQQSAKALAFYAVKVAVRSVPGYNLLIAAVPLGSKPAAPVVHYENLPWVVTYLRNYQDYKKLESALPLDWTAVLSATALPFTAEALPEGEWIVAVKNDKVARHKTYTFEAPSARGKYAVVLESRRATSTHLKDRYEFDLLLDFSHFDVSIERLV